MNNEINKQFVYQTFEDLGLDIDELKSEGIESGGEDWMDVISHIIGGKNAYDESVFTEDDNELIQEFIYVMNENGIEMW
jgi:hypothetical protein